MSSYADMAKRIAAAPPPVPAEKQVKKQKTTAAAEQPPPNKETKGGGGGPKNAWTKGKDKGKGNASATTPRQPPKQPQQQQGSKKARQQQSGKPSSQKQLQQQQHQAKQQQQQQQTKQQKQPNQGQKGAKTNSPKSKTRKPTLKTTSFADILPGNVGKGGGFKVAAAAVKQPPQQQLPQASDFPSLAASNQPAAWPAVSILKRPPQGDATVAKFKPAEKPTASSKPTTISKQQQASKTTGTTTSTDTSKRNAKIKAEPKQQGGDTKPKTSSSSLAASMLGARKERQLDDLSAAAGGEHDLLRLMMAGGGGGKLMTPKAKGRQRVGPRKKKFSSLKKKVLEERLRQWNETNTTSTTTTDSAAAAINKESNPAMPCTLCLYGFAEADLVQDDDEYKELCTNLADLAKDISPSHRVAIPRHISKRTTTFSQYPCFIEFENGHHVQAAISCWNGLALGGDKLEANPIAVPSGIADTAEWTDRCLEVERMTKDGLPMDSQSTCQVILTEILTEDDLEDPDCLEETLADIKRLGEEFGVIDEVLVYEDKQSVLLSYQGGRDVAQSAIAGLGQKVIGGTLIKATLADTSRSEPPRVILHGILNEDDMEDDECLEETMNDIRRVAAEFGTVSNVSAEKEKSRVIIVYVGGIDVAKHAAAELGKKIIGGVPINASVESGSLFSKSKASWTIILNGALTEDDLEDEECLGESLADLKELASKFGVVLSIGAEGDNVKVEFEGPKEVAISAASGFTGIIIGGQIITAHVEEDPDSMDIDNPAASLAVSKEGASTKEPEQLFSGEKLISERFAECLRAPKVPVTPGPRKYATLLTDDTVKPLIIEMLGELMRLQKRAIDDKNAKARRRLVMGFREVARGVRARKVKLVVMANNLDDQYGAIDDTIKEILDLCHREGIPVLFELNKRGIGKALGKTIKVAVVGIQNADGANAQFKKLCKLAQ